MRAVRWRRDRATASLARSAASAVAAVGAITRYRTDSAYPGTMVALLLGTHVALGIGGYLRYLGMSPGWSTRPLARHAACRDRDDDKIPRRRGDEDQPAEQDSEQTLASSHPVLLGASKVAVRGADCR